MISRVKQLFSKTADTIGMTEECCQGTEGSARTNKERHKHFGQQQPIYIYGD